ncbi:hypothetical protein [Kineothrix sp. MB12-C1]|uniref:hypothetical protein n=1 Tax=Kineothrix sp. MB12-C1 TaxID=3070215 RepID=UPI0027D2A955|nr:hypothetical protein [Kineothrix sp. MB12-C1]WMC91621.1 hypothetical protein RBB56_12190 [Kineothrix sp. MB12-C1]
MENERYLRAGIDLKRLVLRFTGKFWMVAAAAAIGAALGICFYLLAHLVFAPQKEYQSVSKIYLNFNCEPEDFNELSYNGYTWNDLLDTDPILDYAMAELPAEVSREEVIAATKAEILSDIRLLTVTVTAEQSELAAQIMEAIQVSLIHLGETDELFHSIEIYSTTEPERPVWDNRTMNAGITGAVLALAISLLVMVFYYVLEDSVYVEADGEKRFDLPVLGIFTAGEAGTFQSYGKAFFANYSYLCRDKKEIALISVDCEEDAKLAQQMMEKILSTARLDREYANVPMRMPEDAIEVYEEVRNMDGVILIVRYGRGNGRRIERAISNLKKQNCKIIGMLIVEADVRFLKRYYMIPGSKRCKPKRAD